MPLSTSPRASGRTLPFSWETSQLSSSMSRSMQGLEAEQDLDALLERGVLPAGERGLGGRDGAGDVGGAGEGDVADDLAVARVVDRQGLAGGGGGHCPAIQLWQGA
jgi:hypothetical protein